MEPILTIIALATLCELVIEAIKPALEPLFDRLPENINPYLYLSLGLGVALALAYTVDLIAAIGIWDNVTVFGQVLTGLLLGRGSNFIHDVIERVGHKPAPDVEPVVWSVGTGSREWQEADLG